MVLELAELELPASAEAALAALNKIAVWDGATYTDWSRAADQPKTTFERNVGRLTDGEYVEKIDGNQYQMTTKGQGVFGHADR